MIFIVTNFTNFRIIIRIQIPVHGCMDDLTTERSFDLLATCVIDVLGLFFDMLSIDVCTTSGNGRRPVDWCRSSMYVLYSCHLIFQDARTETDWRAGCVVIIWS